MILEKSKNNAIETCHSVLHIPKGRAFGPEFIRIDSEILDWIPAFACPVARRAGMITYEIDNQNFYKMNLTNGRML